MTTIKQLIEYLKTLPDDTIIDHMLIQESRGTFVTRVEFLDKRMLGTR